MPQLIRLPDLDTSIRQTLRLSNLCGDNLITSPSQASVTTRDEYMKRNFQLSSLAALLGVLATQPALADYTGTITQLEVWITGNVAFTLGPSATPPCNGQFILNKSDAGTKNLCVAKWASRGHRQLIQPAAVRSPLIVA
jgi:hypothetical protein